MFIDLSASPPKQWQNKTGCGHLTEEGRREGSVVTNAAVVGGRCILVRCCATVWGWNTVVVVEHCKCEQQCGSATVVVSG